MAQGLDIGRVVNINTDFAPAGQAARNTNTLVVLTDEPIIGVVERMRYYTSPQAVAADFGTVNSYAYNAAVQWFSYKPTPQGMFVGRWAGSNTSAFLEGGALNTTQMHLTNFTTVTNGGVDFVIDGNTVNLANLDFSGATNLNAVASIINTALGSHGTLVWNGTNFILTSASSGAGNHATGTVTLTANPANNDTLTLDGVVITFVTGSPTGNQVQIGATTADTTANLLGFLLASTNVTLNLVSYVRTGTALGITYNTVGTAGNGFSLAKSSTAITLSAADLSGGTAGSTVAFATTGTGEDISGLLMMTAALSDPPVQGIAAETPLAAVIALAGLNTYWFAISNVTPNIQESDCMAIAAFIEGGTHIFGISSQNADNGDPNSVTSLSAQVENAQFERSCVCYNGSSLLGALGFLATQLTWDTTQPMSARTAANKVVPGLTPDYPTETQADTMDSRRCNYYAEFDNGTAMTQNGMMGAAGIFLDQVVGLQALANDLQKDEFAVIQSLPSVPQTDDGMHLLTTTNEDTLARYGSRPSCPNGNGFIAPGQWNSAGFGALNTGDTMQTGFYAYREPVILQDPTDRTARLATPGTIAIKLAGSVHKDNVTVNVNR